MVIDVINGGDRGALLGVDHNRLSIGRNHRHGVHPVLPQAGDTLDDLVVRIRRSQVELDNLRPHVVAEIVDLNLRGPYPSSFETQAYLRKEIQGRREKTRPGKG